MPAWMTSRAETLLRSNLEAADQLGETVGLGIGALTRLGENNPVLDDKGNPVIGDDGKPKTEHPSFGQAYQEARQQEADPAWKIKNAQAQSQTWANVARATETWQTYRLKGDEAKMETEDAPLYAKYFKDRQTNPNAVMPELHSAKYLNLARQSSQGMTAEEIKRIQAENQSVDAKITVQNHKSYLDRLQKIDPQASSQIQAIVRKASEDAGAPTIPDEAWQALADAETAAKTKAEADAQKTVGEGGQVTTTTGPRGTTTKTVTPIKKAQSPLGKVYADRKAAVDRGEPPEVIASYDTAIKRIAGEDKEPRMMKLPNGSTALWLPGSKGLHILKDEKKEMEGKAAFEEWKKADSDYSAELRSTGEKSTTLPALKKRAEENRKKLNELFKETDQAPPPDAPTAPPTAASNKPAWMGGGTKNTASGLPFTIDEVTPAK